MAGVLGRFMKHSKNRQEIAKKREALKAEREVTTFLISYMCDASLSRISAIHNNIVGKSHKRLNCCMPSISYGILVSLKLSSFLNQR